MFYLDGGLEANCFVTPRLTPGPGSAFLSPGTRGWVGGQQRCHRADEGTKHGHPSGMRFRWEALQTTNGRLSRWESLVAIVRA